MHRVEIGERTFITAWRRRGDEVDTVIVSLDEGGALVVTPVPVPFADPLALGADPHGLVIVSVGLRGTGTLLRVSLGPGGALAPGAPTPLPEVAWGWPSQILSDGTHAFVHHQLATPGQTVGGPAIYTVDLAAGRVVATMTPPPGAGARCDGGGCSTVTLARPVVEGEPTRASFVHRSPAGGAQRLDLDLMSACPGFHEFDAAGERVFVAPGDPWRAVTFAAVAPFVREAAIDPALAPIAGCGTTLYPFASETHPGLIEGHRSPRALLRWDPARRTFGPRDVLPDLSHERSARYPHTDGVIEVSWTGGSGMQHSPTDANGTRRYFKRWYFESGQVALLRHDRDRWLAEDRAALPLAGASGTMHRGYDPIVLRHGLHAAVLLAPEGGGEPAWLQPHLAPCPAAKPGTP